MGPTLYSMPSSGNSYKVRLLLAHLGRDYAHVACEDGSDTLADAKASGKVPLGKVPALELEDGSILTESNAILHYLADGSDWLPKGPLNHARVLAWMFFEQNRHETVIAVRAALRTYARRAHLATPDRMAHLLAQGNIVLGLMDRHLAVRSWLECDRPTIADIALYAYTHSAGEKGGFDMAQFPAVTAWCARIETLPGHVALDDIPA